MQLVLVLGRAFKTILLFFEIQVFDKIKMHKSEAFHTMKLILVVIFSWRSLKGFQNLAILGVPQTLPRLGASWAARPTLADGEGRGRTRKDKEGEERTWKDKEGQLKTRKDKKGQEGTWKDKEG